MKEKAIFVIQTVRKGLKNKYEMLPDSQWDLQEINSSKAYCNTTILSSHLPFPHSDLISTSFVIVIHEKITGNNANGQNLKCVYACNTPSWL